MKTLLSVSLTVILGAAYALAGSVKGSSASQDAAPKGESTNLAERNVQVMRRLFRAVENHDEQSVLDLYQPDVEFCWPESLPYGGCGRGVRVDKPGWGETWALLQPTDKERTMNPRVIAASDDEVVVLWHQRGLSPVGQRFDDEVLGLYRLRDGKLARAQMFYFDTAATAKFLASALSPEILRKQQEILSRVKKLPASRQANLIETYWKLQAMPRQNREEELQRSELAGTFSPEERCLLNDWLNLGSQPQE